jgi:pilus assembly protein CpaB
MQQRPLLIGLGVALVGVALQALYMRRFEEQASGGAKIELLVAAQPLERGKKITADMLAVRAVPEAYVDDRAVRAADREKVVNLRAQSKVPVLQTLAWTDLIASTDDERDLSSLVQPGNRALPIRVQFEEALALIRPGDFVDVLGVDADGREASVLLQRVLVLAAGLETSVERSSDRKTGYRASLLTLSVSLPEAQLLTLAQTVGRLMVVVRGLGDTRVFDSPPDVGRSELFDSTARQAVQRSSRRPLPLSLAGAVP